jgi:hypothetical protein
MIEDLASPGARSRAGPTRKHIYRSPRGRNDISVLPKSRYPHSLNCDAVVICRMSVEVERRGMLRLGQ